MRRFLSLASVWLSSVLILALAPILTSEAPSAAAVQSPCTSWLHIADISNWNTGTDYKALSTQVAGLYVEQGDGTWVSPVFASETAGAQAAGIPTGAYQFAEPSASPEQTAVGFVWTGGAAGTLPPVLDLEVSGGLSDAAVVDWAIRWINTVENLSHRVPTVYTGAGYGWAYDSRLRAYPLWIAAYPLGYQGVDNVCSIALPATAAWSGFSLWQYTSVGRPAGTTSDTDLSVVEPSWWSLYTGASGGAGGVIYGPGSIGPKVTQIQKIVGAPQTGTYDAATEAKVQTWQVALNVSPADGVWGPTTEQATNAFLALVAKLSKQTPIPASAKFGQHGANITTLRNALVAAHFKIVKPKTDWYGKRVVPAVQALKHVCKLKPYNGRKFGPAAINCLTFLLRLEGK